MEIVMTNQTDQTNVAQLAAPMGILPLPVQAALPRSGVKQYKSWGAIVHRDPSHRTGLHRAFLKWFDGGMVISGIQPGQVLEFCELRVCWNPRRSSEARGYFLVELVEPESIRGRWVTKRAAPPLPQAAAASARTMP